MNPILILVTILMTLIFGIEVGYCIGKRLWEGTTDETEQRTNSMATREIE